MVGVVVVDTIAVVVVDTFVVVAVEDVVDTIVAVAVVEIGVVVVVVADSELEKIRKLENDRLEEITNTYHSICSCILKAYVSSDSDFA